jgi:hypothetical protein
MSLKVPLVIDTSAKNKKLFFGDDGEVVDKPAGKKESKKNDSPQKNTNQNKSNGKFSHKQNGFGPKKEEGDLEQKWHQLYAEHNTDEIIDIKNSEFSTFEDFCKKCFNEEVQKLTKSKSCR